jgi:hypothetical protein
MEFNTNFQSSQYPNRNQNYSKSGGYGYSYNSQTDSTGWTYPQNNYLMQPTELPTGRTQNSNQNGPRINFFEGDPKRNVPRTTPIGVQPNTFPWQPQQQAQFFPGMPVNPTGPPRNVPNHLGSNHGPRGNRNQPIRPPTENLWQPDGNKFPFLNPKIIQKQPTPNMTQTRPINDLNDKLKAIVIEPPVDTPTRNGTNSLGLVSTGSNGLNQPIQPNLNGNKDFTWKLQKPGGFVSQKAAQNKNLVKAERKNSNTEPKAWLYAWLGFRNSWILLRRVSINSILILMLNQYFKNLQTT